MSSVPYSSVQMPSLGQINNVSIDINTLADGDVIEYNQPTNTWENHAPTHPLPANEISQGNSSVIVTDAGTGLITFTTDGVAEAAINTANGLNLLTSKLTVAGSDGDAGDVLTSDGTNVSWAAPSTPPFGTTIEQLNTSVVVSDTGTNGTITTTIDGTIEARLNSNGFGIGISPVEVLDLKANPYTSDCRIRLDAPTGSDTEIKFYNNGAAEYCCGHDDNQDTFVIGFTNVDAPIVTVNKSSQLGVGVNNPSALLDVRANADTDIKQHLINTGQVTTGRKTEIIFGKDNGANLAGALKYTYSTVQADRRIDLTHYTTTNGISILDDGATGIGTQAPSNILEVRGAVANDGILISNANSETVLDFARDSTTTARIKMTEPAALHTSNFRFETSDAAGSVPNLITALTINQNQVVAGKQVADQTPTFGASGAWINNYDLSTEPLDCTYMITCNLQNIGSYEATMMVWKTHLGNYHVHSSVSSGNGFLQMSGSQVQYRQVSGADQTGSFGNLRIWRGMGSVA